MLRPKTNHAGYQPGHRVLRVPTATPSQERPAIVHLPPQNFLLPQVSTFSALPKTHLPLRPPAGAPILHRQRPAQIQSSTRSALHTRLFPRPTLIPPFLSLTSGLLLPRTHGLVLIHPRKMRHGQPQPLRLQWRTDTPKVFLTSVLCPATFHPRSRRKACRP